MEINIQKQEPVDEKKTMGFFQRVAGVVFSPSGVAEALVEKPRILFAFIAMLVTELAIMLLRLPIYTDFLRDVMEMQLEKQGQTVSPEQLEMSLGLARKISLASAGIGQLFIWLVLTVIFFAAVKAFKGEGTFKQTLSITGYAYVIMVLYGLLRLGLSYVTGSIMINSSLALFVPGMKGTLLYGFLRGIDLFSIWYYSVIVIGLSVMSKVKSMKLGWVAAVIILVKALIGMNQAMNL
jgi:hypothetical protein